MDVQILVGDLTKMEVDAIVNPANSEGEMGGGVAAAIKKKGGKAIEEEAMSQAPIPIGKAVVTSAGKLRCDFVVHAPTMRMPAQRISIANVAKAMQAALKTAKEYEFTSIAFPGLGVGVGKVPVDEAASVMVDLVKVLPKSKLQKIVFVDQNKEMVNTWQRCWDEEEIEERAE